MKSNREKDEGRGGVGGGGKTRRHCYLLFVVSLLIAENITIILYFASAHSFILFKVLYYVTMNDISYYRLVQIIHRQL